MRCRFLHHVFLIFVAAVALFERPAAAALTVYEPFDYPVGTRLLGQTNGIGLIGPWTPNAFNSRLHDRLIMESGVIGYPQLAQQGKNRVSIGTVPRGIAGLGRLLSKKVGVPGRVQFLSFIIRPEGNGGYAGLLLGNGQGDELFIGKAAQEKYVMEKRGGGRGQVISDTPAMAGRASLLVVKMEFRSGADRFTLYVDPEIGNPEPRNGFVKEDLDIGLAEYLFIYTSGDSSFDEIRLGDTWADVTPLVPSASP